MAPKRHPPSGDRLLLDDSMPPVLEECNAGEPITRTIMEKFDVPDSGYETVMMLVEMAPHVDSGLHTHPGFDAAYLLEGSLAVLERGKPDKPIRAGESWHVVPGAVHEVKVGDRTTKVLAVYVVERGKPLATPWQPNTN